MFFGQVCECDNFQCDRDPVTGLTCGGMCVGGAITHVGGAMYACGWVQAKVNYFVCGRHIASFGNPLQFICINGFVISLAMELFPVQTEYQYTIRYKFMFT